jgi:hypothetical protein
MIRPAVTELVAAVFRAKHSVVQCRNAAYASRSRPIHYGAARPLGAAASSASATVLGEFLESGGQIEVAAESCAIEPLVLSEI